MVCSLYELNKVKAIDKSNTYSSSEILYHNETKVGRNQTSFLCLYLQDAVARVSSMAQRLNTKHGR